MISIYEIVCYETRVTCYIGTSADTAKPDRPIWLYGRHVEGPCAREGAHQCPLLFD